MKKMTIKEISQAVLGQIISGNKELLISKISIDTRKLKKGDLFFAIKGENFDGHDYVLEAVEKGAKALVVAKDLDQKIKVPVIKVKDTTIALQNLASYYRNKLSDLKVIAITGSAGKTTTKDMIASILTQSFKVKKTPGNFNNYYGLPLTIFTLTGKEDFAVLEMGMSALGEIQLLTKIAKPETGVITNVGAVHLETLGTITKVAQAKAELINNLGIHSKAVLNYDNQYVREMANCFYGKKIIYYGLNEKADIWAKNISTNKEEKTISFDLDYYGYKDKIVLNKAGEHNVYNALAAIAVAREYKVSWQDIKNGLNNMQLSSLRWDITQLDNKISIINDSYNANPLSMEAALKASLDIAPKRLIAVLGDMLELGEKKVEAHLQLGKVINDLGVDLLLTVGELGEIIAKGALEAGMDLNHVYSFTNNKQAGEKLVKILKGKDTVLIKGSRGVKMEEIVDMLK